MRGKSIAVVLQEGYLDIPSMNISQPSAAEKYNPPAMKMQPMVKQTADGWWPHGVSITAAHATTNIDARRRERLGNILTRMGRKAAPVTPEATATISSMAA
jgi:hypothetical protein